MLRSGFRTCPKNRQKEEAAGGEAGRSGHVVLEEQKLERPIPADRRSWGASVTAGRGMVLEST